MRRAKHVFRWLLPVLGELVLTVAMTAAPLAYDVQIQTPVGSGYLDFQFIPGFGAAEATVTISQFEFVGGGELLDPSDAVFTLPFNTPTATGNLQTNVLISNGESFNAFLQRLDFGVGLRFRITLEGTALEPEATGSGTNFTLYRYDAAGNGAPDVPLLTLSAEPGAGVAVSGLEGVSATLVPEPVSLALVGAGLLVFLVKRPCRTRHQPNGFDKATHEFDAKKSTWPITSVR